MPGNYATTVKYGLRKLLGTSLARDIDEGFASLADDVDGKMVGYSAGLLAARPVSTGGSPGVAGRRYRASDTGQEFIDTGTGWEEILLTSSARWGKSIIATSQQVFGSGTFTVAATPDRVAGVVVPTDGFLKIKFSAIVDADDTGGDVALFIGANQLKKRSGTGAPAVHQITVPAAGIEWVYTTGDGLAQTTGGGTPSTVTTGTILSETLEIDVAAGTYTVEARYKATGAGPGDFMTVSNRKLLVRSAY